MTLPASVNLIALARRLRRICCSRWASVVINAGSSAAVSTRSSRPLSSACTPNACSTTAHTSASSTAAGWMSTRPASILERSRMSSIRCSSSDADAWMVLANSVCFAVRFESRLSASSRDSNSSELSGVRSSWLMFARNSDLYWLASASCCAFSSTPRRAASISMFLSSTLRFCSESCSAFSSSSALVRCSSADWSCSSVVSRWDCASSSSVRRLAWMVARATPIVVTSRSRKVRCSAENGVVGPNSITPSDSPSNRTGSTTIAPAGGGTGPGAHIQVAQGQLGDDDALLAHRGLADQTLAEAVFLRRILERDRVPGAHHPAGAGRSHPRGHRDRRPGRRCRPGPRPAARPPP